jgi:hypothetical protein
LCFVRDKKVVSVFCAFRAPSGHVRIDLCDPTFFTVLWTAGCCVSITVWCDCCVSSRCLYFICSDEQIAVSR